MKLLITLLFIIGIQSLANGQNAYISGNIIDSAIQQPVPQASLKIYNKQTGTVTNNDGKFMLLLQNVFDDDSIKVSCVGYETKSYLVANLRSEKLITIKLVPQIFNLGEVTIRPQSIATILREAITTTNALLPRRTDLNAYYKEFLSIDKQIFKYADAAVDYVVDNNGKQTEVNLHVIESRIKKDSVTKDNEWLSEAEAFIKPDKAVTTYYNLNYLGAFVNPKNEDKFIYKIEYLDNISKITIDPKMEIDEYLPNVVIYVNAEKHTILKVESDYHTHQQYAKKVNLIFIVASVEKNKMTAIYSDGDLPLLRYCKIDQDLRIKLGKNKGVLGSLAEVLIHGNGPLKDASGYTGSNVYKKGSIYKNGNKYTEEFWFKYNTLLPTTEEIKVLQEVR